MSQSAHEPIRDPQQLEPSLIERAADGDVDGMVALYEPTAVVATGGGRVARGASEIRELFAGLLASRFVFHAGEQFPAILNGRLALTSSRYPNGTLSSEVARQQDDGSWLWIIDCPTLGAEVSAATSPREPEPGRAGVPGGRMAAEDTRGTS